jgi:hypothetical protein
VVVSKRAGSDHLSINISYPFSAIIYLYIYPSMCLGVVGVCGAYYMQKETISIYSCASFEFRCGCVIIYHTDKLWSYLFWHKRTFSVNSGVIKKMFQQKFQKRKKKGLRVDCKIQVIWHTVASTNLSDKTKWADYKIPLHKLEDFHG